MNSATALIPVSNAELAALSAVEITARLERYSHLYKQAMRPATVRAVRSDWTMWATWCRNNALSPLGVTRDDIARFLRESIARGLRRAALDRYLFTIRIAHRAAGVKDPTDHIEWKLFWKAITQELAADGRNRRRPADPLRESELVAILGTLGTRLRDLRDAALLCIASDTLARREELARIRVDEITHDGDVGVLDIPTSKTDAEGHGKLRHLSAETMAYLARWLDAAGITRGPVFRAVKVVVTRRGKKSTRTESVGTKGLAPAEIARIFKRRAARACIDATRISGHSTRVGSTHDLVAAGFSSAQIALNGGWANENMVLYYARGLKTKDTPMAEARRHRPLPAPPES